MEDAERLLKEGPGALRPLRNKWSGQAASERFGQGGERASPFAWTKRP